MKTAFAFVALGVLACTTPNNKPGEGSPLIQQARAAIKALEDRDRGAVEACEADVQACVNALPDGGASGACDELREQCREAKDALDDVRTPAVECWREVEECAARGSQVRTNDAVGADAGAGCNVTPQDCEDLGADADDDRDPILECRDEVRECISSVRHRAQDWREQCGEVREACSDICGLSSRVGHERQRHGGRAQGFRQRVRELLDGLRDRRHAGHGHGNDDDDDDDRADAGRR